MEDSVFSGQKYSPSQNTVVSYKAGSKKRKKLVDQRVKDGLAEEAKDKSALGKRPAALKAPKSVFNAS